MNIKHNKDEVIKKGMLLFAEKGYEAVGVNEIYKETGMSKGAFYHAFETKEGFLEQCIQSYGEQNIKSLEARMKSLSHLSPNNRLEEIYVHFIRIQPETNYMGCLINKINSEVASSNKHIGQKTTILLDNVIEVFARVVKEGQQTGELRNDIESLQLARLIHYSFYGILTQSNGKEDVSEEIELIRTLIKSMQPHKSNNN